MRGLRLRTGSNGESVRSISSCPRRRRRLGRVSKVSKMIGKIAMLLSQVRVEEKLLFEELDKRGIEFDRIYDNELIFRPGRKTVRL